MFVTDARCKHEDCHRFVVHPLYFSHISFNPEREFSALHPIISLENIWQTFPASSNQWRTQEFCSEEIQQIQLRTEDRDNRDLGAVAR